MSPLLTIAAAKVDGSARSFPAARNADMLYRYAYHVPNDEYARLFRRQASMPSSQQVAQNHASAGWLIPDEPSQCHPVLIGHSLGGVLSLLYDMLPDETLSDEAWQKLAQAVVVLATDPNEAPPSAQQLLPANDSEKRPRSSRKRKAVSEEEVQLPETVQSPRAPPCYSGVAKTRRSKKQEELRQQKRHELGLVKPVNGAAAAEKYAYGNMRQDDEPQIAWIIKQPFGPDDFFHSARSPYATADTMVQIAYSVGSVAATTPGGHFVDNWRKTGHPLLVASAPSSSSEAAASISSRPRFGFTWEAVTFSESAIATAGVVYRWGMASIGREYQRTIAEETSQGGEGQARSRAKRALWDQVRPSGSWAAFNVRLKRSRRWFEAAQMLGWGFLLLLPAATVTPNWVEQTLRAPEWRIWLQLVQRVNPGAVQASRDFDAWLGPSALEGGPITNDERLGIEAALEMHIQEVSDSES